MKTAFVIRMHYKKTDKRWPWRLAYFQAVVLPKILAQKDQDFDICMRVNPHHSDQVLALSDKIKIFDAIPKKRDWVDPKYRRKQKKYFVDFIDYKYLTGLDRYDIQIGIDSDDIILRDDFVSRAKQEVLKDPTKSLHISFQPHIFHANTLRMFECPTKYGEAKGSPIFAYYQPESQKRYIYAYEYSHLKMPTNATRKIRIEEDYCCYSVHDCNSSTGLYHNMKQILI